MKEEVIRLEDNPEFFQALRDFCNCLKEQYYVDKGNNK